MKIVLISSASIQMSNKKGKHHYHNHNINDIILNCMQKFKINSNRDQISKEKFINGIIEIYFKLYYILIFLKFYFIQCQVLMNNPNLKTLFDPFE